MRLVEQYAGRNVTRRCESCGKFFDVQMPKLDGFEVLELIAQKALHPVIARVMPVEQAAEAHRILAKGEIMGKIVLTHS